MDEPTKRAWSRPEMIVLVRSGPEEVLLRLCKSAVTGTGSAAQNAACYEIGCASVCDAAHAS
jgi:hypothetical protein